jgi:PqqD family protein of HPr-rel-A system
MKIDPHIALSETGFLFHASTGDSYTVNTVGQRILQWIKEGKDREEILRQLLETYEVDGDRAEEDMDDFLQYLQQQKILIDA